MQIKYSNEGIEPVSLAEVKGYLGDISFIDDDFLLEMLITAVREQAERYCERSFIVKTIEYFNEAIEEEIVLPFPDHDSITEVQFNGEVSTAYKVTGLTQKVIVPDSVFLGEADDYGVYVKYTTLGTCPMGVKLAMLKIIDEQYRNRGNTFEGSLTELSENAYALLEPYKI